MDRRRFLQGLAIAAAAPALPVRARAAYGQLGPLRADRGGILDLPEGFSYRIVSSAGARMDDGLRVPQAHDGMAAFAGADGRVNLVCNHELAPADFRHGAFGNSLAAVPQAVKDKIYDLGGGLTPGAGGTTTTVYNPASGETERQYLSLAGTEMNCAGGATPWGSWLSCEECCNLPGTGWSKGRIARRDKAHGYVFEVPADSKALVNPRPIKSMGRFKHEAAAVHERSGIVYMTEDQHHSLFYRFIPDVPGNLDAGGTLQALAIEAESSFATHNWSRKPDIHPGKPLPTRWITLTDVDGDDDDLRDRGAERGAATFARGEGLCAADGKFVFTCTIGGRSRLGQVFAYSPSQHEGEPAENNAPGHLVLIAEAADNSLLRNADNIVAAPWGDLLACEDTEGHCGIVGIQPDGSQYAVADNVYSDSELAGACFSPDGTVLFVNIQYPGMTLAITGPWPG
jgi:secreted PhoX family phosphatase